MNALALETLWKQNFDGFLRAYEAQVFLELEEELIAIADTEALLSRLRADPPSWFRRKTKGKTTYDPELLPQLTALAEKITREETGREIESVAWIQTSLDGLLDQLVGSVRKEILRMLEPEISRLHGQSVIDPLRSAVDLLLPFGETRKEIRHTKLLSHFLTAAAKTQPELYPALLTYLQQCAQERLDPAVAAKLPFRSVFAAPQVRSEDERELPDGAGERHLPKIDITLRFPEKKPLSLFIEAKVDSGEGANQLEDYETVAHLYRDWYGEVLFLFLTLDRSPPEEPARHHWIPISWAEIAGVLFASIHRAPMTDETAFLRLWLGTLIRHTCECPSPDDVLHTQEIAGLHRLRDFLRAFSFTLELLEEPA
jgi:hypothetical protein